MAPAVEAAALAESVTQGDRRALARAITLVESIRADHRRAAAVLLETLMPATGGATRIGISGAPGVGKSTFIEALGNHLVKLGHRVAVLTIDPSSSVSGGSILGDKTRMETLARRPEAFIRPSAAGATLGGVARRSLETLLLCEAAGFDVVIVETVGVGQSETRVAEMTDMFVLLLQPGGGDELQGIKRGIMELADLVVINKADDGLADLARHSAADYRSALRMLHPRTKGWQVEVRTCSARDGTGIGEAWSVMQKHQEMLTASGLLETRRAEQARGWLWMEVQDRLVADFRSDPGVRANLARLEADAAEGRLPAATAAEQLLEIYLGRHTIADDERGGDT